MDGSSASPSSTPWPRQRPWGFLLALPGFQGHAVEVVGTNISFNRYFYKYEQPRDPQDIASEILDLEDGLEDFMKEFLK